MKKQLSLSFIGFAIVTAAAFAVTAFADPTPNRPVDLMPWRTNPLWGYQLVQEMERNPPAPNDGPNASWRDPRAVQNPRWKDMRIAHVDFDQRGDLRRNSQNDFQLFRINENGRIDGSDLLTLSRPAEAAMFERLMGAGAPTGPNATARPSMSSQYREYLGQLVDQGMAMLTMNRILDHEAMKKRLLPEPSDDVIHYVMFSILIQNAMDRGQWRGQSPGQVALYNLLKQTVGENPVRFNIDWTFNEHLQNERRALCDRDHLEYPETALTFTKLPPTVVDFQQELVKQLTPTHRQIVRQTIWRALLARKFPQLSDPIVGNMVSTRDMSRVYDILRDTAFRIQPMTSRVSDLVITGPKAEEFKTAFVTALNQRGAQLTQELFTGAGAGGAANPQEDAATRTRIVQLRESVPAEILAQVRSQFAADIAARRVVVSFQPREIRYNGTDDLSDPATRGQRPEAFTSKNHCNGYTAPAAETAQVRCENAAQIELQQKRVALNPIFSGSGVFPKTEHVDCNRSIRIMLMRDLIEGTPSHLAINDRRVEPLLRAKVLSAKQGVYSRELAYDLFRANLLQWDEQTCTEEVWPCGAGGRDGARRFTELMFRETMYPKDKICSRLGGGDRQRCEQSPTGLGMDGPGRPITSTLGRSELFDRVMEIDGTSLTRAMQIANDHVDPRY